MKVLKPLVVALSLTSLTAVAEDVEVPELPEPEVPVCDLGPIAEPFFVRGAINMWSEDNQLCYTGERYETVVTMPLELEATHFKLATSDWSSYICSIDSKYPSTEPEVLFSEEAAQPLEFGVPAVMDCYNEEERKESGEELVFTAMKAAYVAEGDYVISVTLNEEELWEIQVDPVVEEVPEGE